MLADVDLQGSDFVLSGMGMGRMNCLTFCQSMCVLCYGLGGHGSLAGWGAMVRGSVLNPKAQGDSPKSTSHVTNGIPAAFRPGH